MAASPRPHDVNCIFLICVCFLALTGVCQGELFDNSVTDSSNDVHVTWEWEGAEFNMTHHNSSYWEKTQHVVLVVHNIILIIQIIGTVLTVIVIAVVIIVIIALWRRYRKKRAAAEQKESVVLSSDAEAAPTEKTKLKNNK